MQILVNGKQFISLILVAAYYSQRKRKEKARKAKHAEAGVEISNHECKHSVASVCCPHTCFATNAFFMCCYKDSQQTIAELKCSHTDVVNMKYCKY